MSQQPSPLALLEQLIRLGQPGDIITDEMVGESPDRRILVPRGSTYKQVIQILQRKWEEEEELFDFSRTFPYKPWDGAVATWEVMQRLYGITTMQAQHTFFGPQPPQMREVEVGPGKKVQVPWGTINVHAMEGAELTMGSAAHSEYGVCFALTFEGKRKYKSQLEALFNEIENELHEHSIYKGRAIIGHENPVFMDTKGFDPKRVVYSDKVAAELAGTLWGPIRYADAMERDGIPRRRRVLLHGPYGAGKTLAGGLTAEVATESGWTFISARTGRDDLQDVMRTARMYQPSVVFFEDVDNATSTGDRDSMAQILDAFDGLTSKDGDIIAVLTTNHIKRIHKGMLRPGRLDAVIEIAAPDASGIKKLVLANSSKLDDEVDFAQVGEAMLGFLPAFVVESVNRASAVAISRVKGEGDYTLTTSDLVTAAHSLRPQLAHMEDAKEGEVKPSLDAALEDRVRTVLADTTVEYTDPNHRLGDISLAPANGNGQQVAALNSGDEE